MYGSSLNTYTVLMSFYLLGKRGAGGFQPLIKWKDFRHASVVGKCLCCCNSNLCVSCRRLLKNVTLTAFSFRLERNDVIYGVAFENDCWSFCKAGTEEGLSSRVEKVARVSSIDRWNNSSTRISSLLFLGCQLFQGAL